MLEPGPAKKITIHLNDDTTSTKDFLYRDILTFLLEKGVSGATLIRPNAGFGLHRHLHTDREELGDREHLPIRIEFIERSAKLDEILPALRALVTDGLIEVQDTHILQVSVHE